MKHLFNQIHQAEFSELCTQIVDASADMILCDLPYGLTTCQWDTVIPFEIVWAEFKRIVKPKGVIVLTGIEPFASMLRTSWIQGYRFDIIWDKVRVTGHLNAKHQPMRRHENILVFSHASHNYYPQMWQSGVAKSSKGGHSRVYGKNSAQDYKSDGERYPTSVFQLSMPDIEKGLHPTQKPLKLFDYLIRTFTKAGDLVIDPCCGSGTTAIACSRLDRNFVCGDISNEYVQLARDRLKKDKTYQSINVVNEQMPLF